MQFELPAAPAAAELSAEKNFALLRVCKILWSF